jgi:HD-GYP domain-containing protein (c-di-GMP phosphodiesterase class II)
LTNLEQQSADTVRLIAEFPALINTNDSTATRRLFAKALSQNPVFYGLYLGRTSGDFYELINLESSEMARETLQARPEARWVEVRVTETTDGRQRHFQYYTEQFEFLREYSEPTDYDPRSRIWFEQAAVLNRLYQTEPYQFAQLQAPGLTLSTRLPDQQSVLGIDLLLPSLSAFLRDQGFGGDNGNAFIFQEDGQILARTNDANLKPDQAAVLIDMVQKLEDGLQTTTFAGEPHFAYVHKIPAINTEHDRYFGVLAPESVVNGPFMSRLKISLMISTALLALILPLSWAFAYPIVRPVRELAVENDKIRNQGNVRIRRVRSHIVEIDELSDSIIEMVKTIKKQEQDQRDLLDAFIQLIAEAIDQKSPYTGAHCARVPELTLQLVKAADESDSGPFRDFHVEGDDAWRELRVGAWLHDCGKVTTPEFVVDKATKLETIHNRIHEIRTRFEVLWRDAEIVRLQNCLEDPSQSTQWQAECDTRQQQLQDDFAFMAECNIGSEFMSPDKQTRLRELASTTWLRYFDDRLGLSRLEAERYPPAPESLPVSEPLLRDAPEHVIAREHPIDYMEKLGIRMDIPEALYNRGELHNLLISYGTLTTEERFKINEHIISTIRMLEALPFPAELSNVPRYASTHHERMDGRGYPRRLKGEDLSIPERMLALADVFEALTACDRPYKTGKTLSQTLKILSSMVEEQHIDRASFEFLLTSGLYKNYAEANLKPEQIDAIDINDYLQKQKHEEPEAVS